jgi:hypothetical protein
MSDYSQLDAHELALLSSQALLEAPSTPEHWVEPYLRKTLLFATIATLVSLGFGWLLACYLFAVAAVVILCSFVWLEGREEKRLEKNLRYQMWKRITHPGIVPQYAVKIVQEGDATKISLQCRTQETWYHYTESQYSVEPGTEKAFYGCSGKTIEEASEYRMFLEEQAVRTNEKARRAYAQAWLARRKTLPAPHPADDEAKELTALLQSTPVSVIS